MFKHCPECGELMTRRRAGTTELEGCPGCGGLFFDKGELQALAADPAKLRVANDLFRAGSVQRVEAVQKNECPKCKVALSNFEFEAFRGIRLDRCTKCEGVFLHQGEAALIAERLSMSK